MCECVWSLLDCPELQQSPSNHNLPLLSVLLCTLIFIHSLECIHNKLKANLAHYRYIRRSWFSRVNGSMLPPQCQAFYRNNINISTHSDGTCTCMYLCVYPATSLNLTAVSTTVEKLFRRYMEMKAFWRGQQNDLLVAGNRYMCINTCMQHKQTHRHTSTHTMYTMLSHVPRMYAHVHVPC